MRPDHASLLPIQGASIEIFLLTSPFCLASQSVSLYWLVPSYNIKLRSSLPKPCDFSDHHHSHQQPIHDGNLCGQPPCTFYHVFGRTTWKHPKINPMTALPLQSLVETHLCPQYLHSGQVATQHTGKPSPCSCLSEPTHFPMSQSWNSKRKGLLCSTA